MQTYVALLRAINLGARNKVSMPDLRVLFDALGAEDVSTYLQSGNVAFRSDVGSPAELTSAIEASIKDTMGLDISVLVRTRPELEHLFAANPFVARADDVTALHVTFCAEAPPADRVKALAATTFDPDQFRVVRREVFLHCPNGYGRTKLNNGFFEKKLGVVATTRNWKTVRALAELTKP